MGAGVLSMLRRDKREGEDAEAMDFFEQVKQWRAAGSPQQVPAPPAQPQTAPAAQQQAAPQAPRPPASRSPFDELLEIAKVVNLDLKPLEELRVFAQQLDQRVAELERDASRLESEAREKRRAAELLKRVRDQLRYIGV
jgi:hypothetical protein